MVEIKKGSRLNIECYKHNGYLDRTSDEAIVIYNDDDMLIVANDHTTLTEHDGESHTTNEPAVLFFFKDKWYNIIGQFKKKGIFFYCNIATPYIIDGNAIKYIDYDLDLRVFPDGAFKILDRGEYKYHKAKMNYPEEIDKIVKDDLSNLIHLAREKENPFNVMVIDDYYYKYNKLKKVTKK